MKVTRITHEKRMGDGRSVVRVIITYVIGNARPKTATLLYDSLTERAQFGSTWEANEHRIVIDMLHEVAEAYMTLAYYGWEGNDAEEARQA